MKEITVRSQKRIEFIDITHEVQQAIREMKIEDGVICIYVPHTTAAITINENADPSVVRDITNQLNKIAPPDAGYSHTEGNADAHIKSSIIGMSINVLVEGGRLCLGTWQGIYFCEFDGPRTRKVWLKLI